MSKESIYKLMKSQEYLPGSMRWRVGSFNENAANVDHIRFTTPDGRAFVIEYVTTTESQKTYSDVFDIIEINPSEQLLKG